MRTCRPSRYAILSQVWGVTLISPLSFGFCFGADLVADPGGALAAHKDKEFVEFFRRSSGWTAGDGALSVRLSSGQVLWLFGDSHLDDIDPKTGTMPCLFQARNAGLLQHSAPG
jgi:hypothetical protein